jgi:hypothetical protein
MKLISLQILVLAGTVAILMVANVTPAFATGTSAVYSGIPVDYPPPHDLPDHRWHQPSPDAVWIAGHHDWIHERWVWVGGYYTYPPHLGAKWIPARYKNGNYYLGHWNR